LNQIKGLFSPHIFICKLIKFNFKNPPECQESEEEHVDHHENAKHEKFARLKEMQMAAWHGGQRVSITNIRPGFESRQGKNTAKT
jgi:hypothetical protein